jgi:hypothetical protein
MMSRALSVIVAALILSALPTIASGQMSPSAPDGPWSGQVQCVLSARGANYQDEQTHTWRITGGPPVMNGMFRQWPAVWSVTGSGNRRVGAGGNGGQTENWMINIPDTRAPIAVWEPASGSIRFGSQHGSLVASGGLTGHTITPGTDRPFSVPLQEWEFPVVDSMSSNPTISGTRTRTLSGQGRGWRQPADVPTVETCTWNYTRVTQVSRVFDDAGVAPAAPRVTLAPAGAPRTIQQVDTTSTANTTPPPPGAPTGAIGGPERRVSTGVAVPPPTGTPGLTGELSPGLACQMAGPVIQSPVAVSPARASIQWGALPGATGYTVARNDVGLITPAPIQANTFVHNAPFDYRVAYTYTVTAQYAVGCGTSRVTVTAPPPPTPTVVGVSAINGNTATRTGDVRIAWNLPGSDATGYLVLGPGLPQNGREILAPTRATVPTFDTTFGARTKDPAAVPFQIDISGVPAGTHTWLIAPFWNTPTGRVIDVNTGARATAKVGFYRVSITGVRVDHETVDNPLSLDGRGDEIYVAAAAYRSGELVAIGKSSVYGDDNPVPILGDILGIFVPPTGFRLRAGTASVTGGLRTGDVIPSPNPILPTNPPVSTMFPFVVWEGWLGGGSEVLVKPTIWEWDGDLTNYNNWSALMRGWTTASPGTTGSTGTTQSALMVSSLNTQLRQISDEQTNQDRLWKEDLVRARTAGASPPDNRTSRAGYDRAIGGLFDSWISVQADGLAVHRELEAEKLGEQRPTPRGTTAAVNFTDAAADLAGRYTMFVVLQQLP